MQRRCGGGCGAIVNDQQAGVYREVSGWERVRSGGGAHSITLRSETGRVLCSDCMRDKKAGKLDGQVAML